jgi:hypothetical protein
MRKDIHHRLGAAIFAALVLNGTGAWAVEEVESYCQDAQVNQRWQQAVADHKGDPLVTKLYTVRRGLCEMLADRTIDGKSARFMWDQAVINALVEKGREAAGGTALLRLFGTF